MTTAYLNEFTGSNGSAPSHFTVTQSHGGGGTVDIQSNKLRLLTSTTIFQCLQLVLPTAQWNAADGEVLLPVDITGAVGQLNLIFRGSGDWSVSDVDAPQNGYFAHINFAGHTVEMYKMVSSTPTQLATVSFTDFGFVAATFWIRFRVESDDLTLTVWNASGSEPGSPTLTASDSSIAGAGQFQLSYRTVAASAVQATIDSVTIDNLVSLSPLASFSRYIPGTVANRSMRGW